MFGRPKNELPPPPIARNAEAVEVLRVWSEPDAPQVISIRTAWEDPGAWGLLLVDIARHAAKAYAAEGVAEAEAFERILQLFRAELASPTDTLS